MEAVGLRINEFASTMGVTVRSIRFYHQLGILQRPVMAGRVGRYTREHVERLRLVRSLQNRGYSLAAIADTVATQMPAIYLGEVGRTDPATAVWDRADPQKLSLGQLTQMMPALVERPELIDRMVGLGLLAHDGADGFTTATAPLLRAGIRLVDRGVPLSVALDELEGMRIDLGHIAHRFAEVVQRDMIPARDPAGTSTGEATRALLREVWPAVLVAVGQVLTDSIQQAVATPPTSGGPSTGTDR